MCECICRCTKGEYKGLEFKFTAKAIQEYDYCHRYNLFFTDLRQASDFIIKFFLNAYEPQYVEMSLTGEYCNIHSPSIEIEKAVI